MGTEARRKLAQGGPAKGRRARKERLVKPVGTNAGSVNEAITPKKVEREAGRSRQKAVRYAADDPRGWKSQPEKTVGGDGTGARPEGTDAPRVKPRGAKAAENTEIGRESSQEWRGKSPNIFSEGMRDAKSLETPRKEEGEQTAQGLGARAAAATPGV